jgi:hypothetical protein
LLLEPGMERIKSALIAGDLDSPAIERQMQVTLIAARPVFHRHLWEEQDRVNRVWITSISELMKTIAPQARNDFDQAAQHVIRVAVAENGRGLIVDWGRSQTPRGLGENPRLIRRRSGAALRVY